MPEIRVPSTSSSSSASTLQNEVSVYELEHMTRSELKRFIKEHQKRVVVSSLPVREFRNWDVGLEVKFGTKAEYFKKLS